MSVLIETSLGTLVIDLQVEKCPLASRNFLKLCKVKYYNYSLVHSVQPGFMLQTGAGNPSGDSANSSSIYGLVGGESARFFRHEIHRDLRHDRRGVVSMIPLQTSSLAKGADGEHLAVNASQFFITLSHQPATYLDGKHTVFGEVVEGWDTIDAIESAYCDSNGRPLRDIRILHTIILDDPFDDLPGMIVPPRSPSPPREVLESTRLLVEDPVKKEHEKVDDETADRRLREKEASVRATTLEILGDLPYANIKPPENVLFVCKLNPVTRADDLELIFSRFGSIESCEIIRDPETGKSLNYAFIEFAEKEACEEAYFKMQNVLIDDRRIHVDFSQSVSKLHKSWAAQTLKKKEFGGERLYRKEKYRDGSSNGGGAVRRADKYSMVFDDKRSRNSKRGRSRSRSPQ
eukprot:Partr_v1_DN25515_c0_g1_i1_m20518 putative peptidylprolyl cistrans